MQTFHNSKSWNDYKQTLSTSVGIEFPQDPQEHHEVIRGHKIRLDEWRPSGEPVGTLILVHGGGGNGRVLAPFALPALSASWQVLAPDLPGYGLTAPADGFDWDYAEWPETVAELASRQKGCVVLMGLSMGGLTAFVAAQKSQTVEGVIATTLIDLSDRETFVRAARWRWLGKLSLISMKLAPWLFDRLRMPLSLATPLSAMSSIQAIRRYFQNDRLLGSSWIQARFFRTMHRYTLRSSKLDCPILLVHPGSDEWTPTSMSLDTFDKIDAPKDFIELSNGAHLPIESPAFAELGEAMKGFLDKVTEKRRIEVSA